MKNKVSIFVLSLGWVLLAIFLFSGYYFNKFSEGVNNTNFSPIAWEDHMQMFKGAVQCTLTDDDLLERKKLLKEKIFSKVNAKKEMPNGIAYYFSDDKLLLADAIEFILKEKACCPFFKFDLSILPFDNGFAIQISGSEEAMAMLKDFESNEF